MTDFPPGRPPVLIGLAHGSRHPATAESIDDLMTGVSELARCAGSPVLARTAFLDLTDPDLPTVGAELVADGLRSATVVPLLFTRAFHATVDVPEAVTKVTDELGMTLTTTDIVGTGADLVSVLAQSVELFADRPRRVLLYSVGSSMAAANEAVLDLGARLAERLGRPVVTGFGTCAPFGRDLIEGLGAGDAVVPLFIAPGLLLGPMTELCADRGIALLPPLGRLLAPVILDRFRRVQPTS